MRVEAGWVSDELVNIGNFALASGLSISMLRYYHELGLLVPASVDAATGYRRYSLHQVTRARTLARLRDLDVPVAELGAALNDPASLVEILRAHRDRLAGRLEETKEMLDNLDELLTKEMTLATTGSFLIEVILRTRDLDASVAFYRDVFGFEFQADDHNGAAPRHYDACGGVWTQEGAKLFTLWPAEAGTETSDASIGFAVPNVNDVWARALAAGARELTAPTDDPYIPRNAAFADPAGNRVAIYERAGW